MILPKELIIKETDSIELKEVKNTLNALIAYQRTVQKVTPNTHFKPRYFTRTKPNLDYSGRELKDKIHAGTKESGMEGIK